MKLRLAAAILCAIAAIAGTTAIAAEAPYPNRTVRFIIPSAPGGGTDFIARLPEGYDTKTGERGLAVSVGERQRIALARALLRRPSVLILDEPTSALDARTEGVIASNLRAALRGGTLIVITHRPALAELADMVVMLENGKARMTHELESAVGI